MRLAITLLIPAAGLCALTGCSGLISLNSFAPDGLLVQNPLPAGSLVRQQTVSSSSRPWIAATRLRWCRATKNDGTLTFNAQLFGAGNAEILDLVPADDKDPFR